MNMRPVPQPTIHPPSCAAFSLPFLSSEQKAGTHQFCDASISITTDLQQIEDSWRDFEQRADCTPFQTFEWLSTWQRHVGAFDFTIGDEAYKRDWTDARHVLYDHVSGVGWRGRSAASIIAMGLVAKHCIKTSRALWNAVTRLRPMIARVRRLI